MSEPKNVKRNSTRPKAKDKGMYSTMQRNYNQKKKQVELTIPMFKTNADRDI